MKRRIKMIIPVLITVILLPGCSGLKRMQQNSGLIRYRITPEVMETHAGKVDIAFNGILPGSYFDKKATLTATPVIRYESGETPLPPVTLQGEQVKNNYRVISSTSGGNFSYRESFPYREEMRKSELVVKMEANRKSKSVTLEPIVVAPGILATNTLMAVTPKAVTGIRREPNNSGKYDPAIDPFQRVVPDEMVADITYLINSAVLRKEEADSKDVRQYLDYTTEAHNDDTKEVKRVEISAYASPDGSLDLNTDLASSREKTTTAFVEDQFKKANVEANLRTRYTPEDWEGFRLMLEASDIQDKDLILRVLSMYTDPEVREREIRNLSSAFTQLADEVLPKLRRAKLLTSVNLIGKSDEEIVAFAESNPSSLNQAELLYAATLTPDNSRKMKIYTSFAEIFPNDWRGPNNIGAVLAGQLKFDEAKPWFLKAEALRNDEPVIKNNLGIIAFVENNLPQAEELFGAASGAGNEVNYNLALVSIRKGDYNRANQYFRSEADPNTALVKLISGNYNGALNDLESFERDDCYLKEYLRAVIGARTNREDMVMESLAKAIAINPIAKKLAATDMEFRNYFDNNRFQAVIR